MIMQPTTDEGPGLVAGLWLIALILGLVLFVVIVSGH